MTAPSTPPLAPLLETRGLGKRYGAVAALLGLDLVARGGEVHALTGANGAGKSTLMNLLAGVVVPSAGEILIEGRPVRFASPAQACAAGISSVHQELAVLPELTVAENVWLGREPRTRWGLLDRRALRARTASLLREHSLPLEPDTPVAALSIANRQLVEIARALSTWARILTLDEPTAVLSVPERRRLFGIVGELKRRGLLVFFVSHRLDEVFEIADRVTVLRNGRKVYEGSTAETSRSVLVRQMVGHGVDGRAQARTFDGAVGVPIVVAVHAGNATPVTLTLHAGEIVGFGGLIGGGRTRLARRLAGLEHGAVADYEVGAERFTVRSPRQAVGRGIVYLTEDRKRDGLFSGLSVLRNTSAASLPKVSRWGFVSRGRERRAGAPILERLRLVAASLQMPARALSGGNQQKVLFARALMARPRLLICDEPTRGVDVGAREEIYAVIEGLAREGVAIVLISSDLQEVLALCSRVLVVRGAAVVAELAASASELDIVEAAVGNRRESSAGQKPKW